MKNTTNKNRCTKTVEVRPLECDRGRKVCSRGKDADVHDVSTFRIGAHRFES